MDEQARSQEESSRRRSLRLGAVMIGVFAGLTMMTAGHAEAHHRKDDWEQRKHIRRRSKNAVGTPYRYGGSSGSGTDCSGFSMWMWGGHGANLPHSSMKQFELGKRDRYKRVWKRGKLKVGDLVFHKTTSAKVGHVGIYIGRGRFISATSSSGVRVRSIWDPHYWGPRWVGATRLPAVIDG